jgi:cytoskeletal protein CcmA (bactofilin family)
VIPAANSFRWPQPIRVGSAEVAGELQGIVQAQHTVVLRSTARFFGNLEAGDLAIEPGAVIVGSVQIGNRL